MSAHPPFQGQPIMPGIHFSAPITRQPVPLEPVGPTWEIIGEPGPLRPLQPMPQALPNPTTLPNQQPGWQPYKEAIPIDWPPYTMTATAFTAPTPSGWPPYSGRSPQSVQFAPAQDAFIPATISALSPTPATPVIPAPGPISARPLTPPPALTQEIKPAYSDLQRREQPFTDVAPSWYYPSIEMARQWGVMVGYPDGTFRPQMPATRAEMAAAVTKLIRMVQTGQIPLPNYVPKSAYDALVAQTRILDQRLRIVESKGTTLNQIA